MPPLNVEKTFSIKKEKENFWGLFGQLVKKQLDRKNALKKKLLLLCPRMWYLIRLWVTEFYFL